MGEIDKLEERVSDALKEAARLEKDVSVANVFRKLATVFEKFEPKYNDETEGE